MNHIHIFFDSMLDYGCEHMIRWCITRGSCWFESDEQYQKLFLFPGSFLGRDATLFQYLRKLAGTRRKGLQIILMSIFPPELTGIIDLYCPRSV